METLGAIARTDSSLFQHLLPHRSTIQQNQNSIQNQIHGTSVSESTPHTIAHTPTHTQSHTQSLSHTQSQLQTVCLGGECDGDWSPPKSSDPLAITLLRVSSCSLLASLMALMETPAEQFRTDWPVDGIIGRIPAHMATAYSLRPSLLSLSGNTGKIKSKEMIETKGLLLHFKASDADNSVKHLLSLINTVCYKNPSMVEALTGGTGGGGGREGEGPDGGKSTGIIRSLFNMPIRYFEEERFKVQLLPTLSSLFVGREYELENRIREIVKNSKK